MRAYLAGPDVFLPDPVARGADLKRICAAHKSNKTHECVHTRLHKCEAADDFVKRILY